MPSAGNIVTTFEADARPFSRGAAEVMKDNARLRESYANSAAEAKRAKNDLLAFNTGALRSRAAVQQASYAVDDFAASFGTGGLAGGLRGASNNISTLAASINPMLGAVAGVGIALGGSLVKHLTDAADETERRAKAEESVAEAMKRTIALVDRRAEAVEKERAAQEAVRGRTPTDPIRDKFLTADERRRAKADEVLSVRDAAFGRIEDAKAAKRSADFRESELLRQRQARIEEERQSIYNEEYGGVRDFNDGRRTWKLTASGRALEGDEINAVDEQARQRVAGLTDQINVVIAERLEAEEQLKSAVRTELATRKQTENILARRKKEEQNKEGDKEQAELVKAFQEKEKARDDIRAQYDRKFAKEEAARREIERIEAAGFDDPETQNLQREVAKKFLLDSRGPRPSPNLAPGFVKGSAEAISLVNRIDAETQSRKSNPAIKSNEILDNILRELRNARQEPKIQVIDMSSGI